MRAKARKLLEAVTLLEERHTGLRVSRDSIDLTIQSMFWRARGLFEGCRLLLQQSMPEEALILGRGLFTESLRLMELERAGSERASLVLGWASDSVGQDRGLLEVGRRAGVASEADIEEAERAINDRQVAIREYMARHSVARLRHFYHEKRLAERHGRSDDYWIFVLSHKMVHGSETAHMYKTSRSGDTLKVYLRSSDEPWMDNVAGFCARSILYSDRAACAMLGWEEPVLVEVLLRQATALG